MEKGKVATASREMRAADAMGFALGQLVQELGWEDDVDEDLRDDIMDAIDADLVDTADEAVDAVLLWWRAADGDVADGLVDALTDLSPSGTIWLLTPKVGKPGHVEAVDIAEGAVTAGLALTKTVNVSPTWSASRLVRPKAGRTK